MEPERVTRISKHLPLLVKLRDADEGLRQSEVRDKLNQSKSTTHRKVKTLEEMGLITKADSGYELSRIVTEEVENCVSNIETAYRYDEFLATVARSNLRLDYIKDSPVMRASETNPMAPLIRLAEITAESDEARVLTNSVAPRSFDVGREGVRSGEKEIEMVLDYRTVESVQETKWYGEELEKDLETGNLEIWIYDNEVPYQIGIFDDRLCLGAEDEDGRPTAMLETEDEDALSWARETFERYKRDEEKLLPSDI
ncbi:MAG: MarR family transcriptional regulator [Halobacteria archaeon]|nr:MarR family transcriptional regulator [Halobacteria archaeon]